MIDYTTREPQNLEQMYGDDFGGFLAPEEECPIRKQGRVKPLDNDCWVKDIKSEYSDIDLNGHVNSIKYIEHIMDLFPMSDYENGRNMSRIEIAYMSESYYSDILSLYKKKIDDDVYEVEVRGRKDDLDCAPAQTNTLVRCKLIFK